MRRIYTRPSLVLWLLLVNNSMLFAAALPPNVIQNNRFTYIGQPHAIPDCVIPLGGYRFYNVCHGQFLKQDSDSPFYSNRTINAFNYTAGNPILFVDDSGHLLSNYIDQIKAFVQNLAQRMPNSTSSRVSDAFEAGYRLGIHEGRRQTLQETTPQPNLKRTLSISSKHVPYNQTQRSVTKARIAPATSSEESANFMVGSINVSEISSESLSENHSTTPQAPHPNISIMASEENLAPSPPDVANQPNTTLLTRTRPFYEGLPEIPL